MKHIVSYSGGLNSFAVAERVIAQHGKENVLCVFTDTKSEDEDLYRFITETIIHLGCEYQVLTDGRDLWGVFNSMKFMSNSRVDNCSQVLKRSLFKRWLKKSYKPSECVIYMGFDWNEAHRLPKVEKRYKPYVVKAPLMDKPYLDKSDIMVRLKQIGIRHPRLYDLGFAHNNCGGFCVKAGQAQFRLLYKQMPERYMYHEQEQEKLFARIGPHGFLRIVRGSESRYLSLKQFREEFLDKEDCDKQVDLFDFGGCGCFV